MKDEVYQTVCLSKFIGISTMLADKTTRTDDVDSDSNDVYETIEFSDSSSNLYTEPVREYGVLRKVNIRTTPKTSRQYSSGKKPPSGMKKSTGTRNLQKFKALQDVSEAGTAQNESEVELRRKPLETTNIERPIKEQENSLTSVGLHNIELCFNHSLIKPTYFKDVEVQSTHIENLASFIPRRDVSGILINFECLNSRLRRG